MADVSGGVGAGEIAVSPPSAYPDLGDWAGKKPEVTDVNRQQIEVAERLAWSTMLRLAAGQVVVSPVTVRPICETCGSRTWITRPTGLWNEIGGFYGRDTLLFGRLDGACGSHRAVPLPRPVGRIVQVNVDGARLDPSAYRIDNRNELTRVDGSVWPTGQQIEAPYGSPGTFDITYYAGHRPDALFVWATGQLAHEFLLSMGAGARGQKCRLPSGVTSVVRQGVSYEIENVPFTNGRTSIVEIDSVLARYNPNSLNARPAVASIDSLRRRPRTIPTPATLLPRPSVTPPPIGQDALVQGVLLKIARGADFDGAFRYRTGEPGAEQPVDLTGWSAQAQVRESTGGAVWLTLVSGQEITLGSDGRISLHFAHTRTEGPEWDTRQRGVWDLELTSATGRRVRFAQGLVQVSQDVTRNV